MTNFKAYSSIENSYNDKYMGRIDKDAIYVVTDKDVSNLSAGLIHELYNLMINHNKLTIELDKLACEIGIINDKIKSILPNG